MEGDVIWDSISNLKFKMTEGSILTGGFIQDESCAGNGGSGTADLSIDAESTWIVTKDSPGYQDSQIKERSKMQMVRL